MGKMGSNFFNLQPSNLQPLTVLVTDSTITMRVEMSNHKWLANPKE